MKKSEIVGGLLMMAIVVSLCFQAYYDRRMMHSCSEFVQLVQEAELREEPGLTAEEATDWEAFFEEFYPEWE